MLLDVVCRRGRGRVVEASPRQISFRGGLCAQFVGKKVVLYGKQLQIDDRPSKNLRLRGLVGVVGLCGGGRNMEKVGAERNRLSSGFAVVNIGSRTVPDMSSFICAMGPE